MKTTQQHCPGSEVVPFNIHTHTSKVIESLLIHLAIYNADGRGTLVLIELDEKEQVWIESTYERYADPYQQVAHIVTEKFRVNVAEYVGGFYKLYPAPPPQLEVVQKVSVIDGKLVATSRPMFQILTPFNYYPRKIDRQFVETDYIVPLDYPL